MKPLSEQEIRAAFVNCTKGEAKRLSVPRDLAERPWDDLDFLGWRDPQSPERAYLVAILDDRPKALQLRCPSPASWQIRRGMCSVCLTSHTGGVSLMVAPKARQAGQQGNSVGTYMCSDLACQETVRLGRPAAPSEVLPSVQELERIEGLARRTRAFVADVLSTT
jgi:FBP C-terminal treble-clef zinc-finger